MSGLLLDTNVISEVVKPDPESRVVSFLASQQDLWLSVVVIHEAHYGMQLLPTSRRRDSLASRLSEMIDTYIDRILPVTSLVAELAAQLRVEARQSGRKLTLADALIAGTAMANDLGVATRNVRDFDGLGVEVVNPWEAPAR